MGVSNTILYQFLKGEKTMLKVKANVFAIPVRVVRNTNSGSRNDQWARIVDARTGAILHTGQLRYIKRVAKQRYNVNAAL
jgi:hypothetical protein